MSTFDDMVNFLDSTYILKDQLVPCLVGPVGIGKTAAVMEHAKRKKANVVEIIASQILPNEVSGITMPDSDTKSMEIYDHFRLSSLKDGDILFFDELLEADQLVLSACLTLIESRMMMSGRKLPDVQIIAATNPTISPKMLKASIRQRFIFMSFDYHIEDVRDYIFKDTGILLNKTIINKLETESDKYNILSPRSLTKMTRWIAKTNGKVKEDLVASQIDAIWGFGLGDAILECKRSKNMKNDAKAKLISIMQLNGISEDNGFENSTIEDLMKIINESEMKDQIIEQLSLTEMICEDGK